MLTETEDPDFLSSSSSLLRWPRILMIIVAL